MNLSFLILVLSFLLFTISCGFLEAAFYATIIPIKFQNTSQITTFDEDVALWKKHINPYFTYITLYSFLLLGIILTLGAGGYFIFRMFSHSIFSLYIIGSLFIYFYTVTRFSISWYHILFGPIGNTSEVFLRSYTILQSRVFSSFLKILGFSIIVSIASGVTSYIVQFFMPDFLNLIMQITSEFQQAKDSLNIQKVIDIFVTHIEEIVFKVVYTSIIFISIQKICGVFQIAMKHVFLTQYYFDIIQEKNNTPKS